MASSSATVTATSMENDHWYSVFFQPNEFSISTPEQEKLMEGNLIYLRKYPYLEFRLEGYAADDEPAHLRFSLSLERAESVKAFLVARGVDPTRLHTIGCGSPFDVGRDEAASKSSRRVYLYPIKRRPHPTPKASV